MARTKQEKKSHRASPYLSTTACKKQLKVAASKLLDALFIVTFQSTHSVMHSVMEAHHNDLLVSLTGFLSERLPPPTRLPEAAAAATVVKRGARKKRLAKQEKAKMNPSDKPNARVAKPLTAETWKHKVIPGKWIRASDKPKEADAWLLAPQWPPADAVEASAAKKQEETPSLPRSPPILENQISCVDEVNFLRELEQAGVVRSKKRAPRKSKETSPALQYRRAFEEAGAGEVEEEEARAEEAGKSMPSAYELGLSDGAHDF